jgi:hypothetical protein
MALSKVYNATTTGAGPPSSSPATLFQNYGLQVKGQGGTVTSFTVNLEGSLDGANWTTLGSASSDGAVVSVTGKPVQFVRPNVSALSLGTATSINVYFIAT